ncbi:DUF3866 family protein [Syntrophomonas erecta]
MLQLKTGVIKQELFSRPGIRGYVVLINDREEKCIAYPDLSGEVKPGDRVLLNTTAVSLKLGSGGYHFVVASFNGEEKDLPLGGHIMKLRYTPLQVKVLSAEEEDSPYHQQLKNADSINGIPVLVATLHSMLAPLALCLKQEGLKVAYIMTDGAALPLSFSNTVYKLKENGVLTGSVTIGHAFGGDLEAVNIYSGLLAAREILKPDVIIVSMGPGIVGTGTKWGFTGVEQGEILNAVDTLQGTAIAVPRISFADQRPRHRGISHHTLTVLSHICRIKSILPLPVLEQEKMDLLLQQLQELKLFDHHLICREDYPQVLDWLEKSGMKVTTMGRGIQEEKEFFLSLGAAARTAVRIFKGEPLTPIKTDA